VSLVVLFLLALAVTWWLTSRMRVTTAPVAMVAQRIHFPGGVRLSDPEAGVARLRNPEEIVIPYDQAMLVVDFPLTTPATVQLAAGFAVGFTRAELVRAVCEEYANLYEAEEATAHTKPVPREERTAVKARNRTDGVYGIYGHDLDELVLTAMRWARDPAGTVRIELHVEVRDPPASA
jgi:hypothetical protein